MKINTKILMTSSALFLGIIGILFSFLTEEIIDFLKIEPNYITILFFQLLSAFYLGFGILNWMSKGTQNGAIRWKSYYWVYLTAALKGKYVGIENLGNGIWKVFYRNVFLGFFNETVLRNKEKSIRLETNLV